MPVCDLCGSQAHTILVADATDRFFRLPGRFSWVKCEQCNLARLSPRPILSNLPRYYPVDDYSAYERAHGVPNDSGRPLSRSRDAVRAAVLRTRGYPAAELPAWSRLVPRRLPRWLVRRAAYDREGFPDWTPSGRALDLGCGNGAFLDRIRRHGWDVVGVDISEAAALVAHEQVGIEVHVGALEDAPLENESFDFVHMSHVIEHLPRPCSTLTRVAGLLRPGGRLYVETPNIDSLGFRWTGAHWFPLETPRHLWLFSPSTLQRALQASGFRVQRLRARAFPSTYNWEATYRHEERLGGPCDERPLVSGRSLVRSAALTPISAAARRVSPGAGDILCCWAERLPESHRGREGG